MFNYRVLSTLAICVASAPVFALDQGDYRFNGFGTVGVTHLGGDSQSHGYGISGQTTDGWRGDQLSKLGGQLQYGLTDTIGFTVQMLAKAYSDQWRLRPEWLYLSWEATDKLKFSAGKLGTPIYMYSETLNVGFTNPWIRLPEEVYNQVQLSTTRGLSAVFTQPLSFGSLTLQVAGGQSTNDKNYVLDEIRTADSKNAYFANATLSTNDFGSLRISYSQNNLHTNVHSSVQPPFGPPTDITFMHLDGNKAEFASIGYQFDNGTWVSSNEATKLTIRATGSEPINAFYTMAGRRFGSFLAHVTYGQMDDSSGRESSWTYGLNYNVTPTVVVKGEFKRIDTSGGAPGFFSRNAQQTVDDAVYSASNGQQGSPSRNFDGDIISLGVDFVF
ncbi:hypothetical protein [Pseudomonas gingeri]|uniref:Porin n=1 Tax=Pseudomonas gingeri TaxID=117681 RepID=A0A7Y7YII6_9PSED|nr:hypothetical protein [Pseudomonas gingeri]NVZ99182.1 hypothetical protein [Pseudomonas gingeri]NWA13227.1 hypothetical protein [Pseudomonas gingeri]NWA55488.1 hypothetical protein [Pseudomonas gingeri]NWA95658.1 hypothetical protein [Pseudomonas gingeri]NWB00745.1 hypothetical protein [Pseudomonas gingeri]